MHYSPKKMSEVLQQNDFSLKKKFGQNFIVDENLIDSIVNKAMIDNETLVLNNIEFFENDKLEIKINSNTRSSDVVTLSIGDKYTEGELMTKMKNNSYVCK